MPDMSIGRKFALTFTIILGLVSILGVAVVVNAVRVGDIQAEQASVIGPRAEAADALAVALLRVAVTTRSYALTADPEDARRARQAIADGEAAVAALTRLPTSPVGRVMFEDVHARVRRYLGDVTALTERVAGEGWTPALVEVEQRLAGQRTDLVEVLQRYAGLQRQSMHETRQRIQAAVDGLVTTAQVVTGLALLGSVVTALVLWRGIRLPARRLRAAAVSIIEGDFSPAMALDERDATTGLFSDVRRFHDEIRDAANVFGRMARIVREREERLQAQAEELQAQGEELQAQGEELQAQNEELQSQADELREQAEALRERQDELQRMNRQLRAAEQEKDRFLAVLGHELRNPLAAIRTASTLVTGASPSSRGSEAQTVIARQASHLARLVDDLLDVGRIASGKLTLTRHPLDLAALVERCVAGVRTVGRLQDRTVEVSVTPVWVDADETRLEQIIANLLGNAEKFTAPGGHVDLSVRREGADAVLRVKDDGAGMDASLMERVFDMFVQGDGARAGGLGGLGIGLTLCRQVVELHGGTIDARSDGPGCGSTFTVRLPAIEPPARRDGANDGARVSRRQRIVVIEDNEDGREMLKMWLEASGHEVHAAGDGIAGVELVAAVGPDLALVDLGMPGYDGFEVARRVRALNRKNTVLIALTGYGQAEDARRAVEAGFDMHLVKPIDPDRLIAILDSAGRAQDREPGAAFPNGGQPDPTART
jgi:signal transduction histidine kinase/ActR/RegA family two-component response regulator